MVMDASKKTGYSIKWNSILVFSEKLVAMITGIVLARLLEPKDFGLVAMVNVFVGLTAIFVNAGTGSSIIQKERLSQIELSTIFYFNITVGLVVSLLLFFSAGFISRFYDNQQLFNITRIIAWKPLVNSLIIVQQFLMVRNIDLKKRTVAQLVGQLFAGILGVGLALSGFGVYALVWSMLASAVVSALLYWKQSSWIPSLAFSFARLKMIWNYSGKILYTNVLLQAVNRIDELIVGKYLSATSLGLYNRGKNLSSLPTGMLGQVLSRSFFPILSRIQTEQKKLSNYFKLQSERIIWVTVPLYILLIVIAEDLIVLLLGIKWIGAVPYFRLALIADFIYSNNVFKVYLLNAIGRPDINLTRGLVISPMRILFYLCPIILFGTTEPAYLLLVTIIFYFVALIWLSFNIRSFIGINVSNQLLPILKYAFLTLASTIPAIYLIQGIQNPMLRIPITLFVFGVIYFVVLTLSKDGPLISAKSKLSGLLHLIQK